MLLCESESHTHSPLSQYSTFTLMGICYWKYTTSNNIQKKLTDFHCLWKKTAQIEGFFTIVSITLVEIGADMGMNRHDFWP